eukprot:3940804-Rhodomonas_salina.2
MARVWQVRMMQTKKVWTEKQMQMATSGPLWWLTRMLCHLPLSPPPRARRIHQPHSSQESTASTAC